MTVLDKSKQAKPTATHANGACWLDAGGANTIQAHGGGVLLHDGFYYWYGENRQGPVQPGGERKRIDTVGVSCYRSRDLLSWEPLGLVLPVADDPAHDLHASKVIERPKVIFNSLTNKFVMWLHIDSADYAAARAGVAVADNPDGPFRYIRSIRPNGFMSRDQTLFQDDDGRAYHVCASDDNATTMISLLEDDYLDVSGKFTKIFPGRFMEAFALCKRKGRYWMLASGCSGWEPNEARSAVTEDLFGDWEERGNPCAGDGAELTFGAQSAFIIPPARRGSAGSGGAGGEGTYVAMFDVWRPADLRTSGYTWLPIDWSDGKMNIRHQDVWAGSTAAAPVR
ncbi:MAG TPA: glycoside hydrolase family 43 protein [Tepidisphaeraceae bacterium]|nr:glycoside hydrolase family 43 protein [Tepidisphaeraceae bacterium]